MTLADLIADFRTQTDDLEPPYLWSDSEIVGYLNDAENEACIRAGLLVEEQSIRLPASNPVTLAPGVLEVREIRLASSGLPLRNDWRALRADESGGEPRLYAVMGDRVFLTPQPTAADTLIIRVSRLPLEPLSPDRLSGEPEIPASDQPRLLDWALFRAYSKRDADSQDRDRAMTHAAHFDANFGPRPSAHARRQYREAGRRGVRFTPF